MIRSAPVAFTICVLIVAALGIGAVSWILDIRYRDRLELANKRADFNQELVAEYREKLNVESPEAAVAKLRDSEAEITELKERELRLVEQKVEENADGTYTISTVMQVVSPIPPAGLDIKAEADGLIEMNVRRIEPQPSLLFSMNKERINPNTMCVKINSPSGKFLITVRAKEPKGMLYYSYDKRIC